MTFCVKNLSTLFGLGSVIFLFWDLLLPVTKAPPGGVISHNYLHAQNGFARRSTTGSTVPRDSKKWIILYNPWLLGCYQQYETLALDISPLASPRADISGSGLILLITTRKSWFIYYLSCFVFPLWLQNIRICKATKGTLRCMCTA